MKIKIWKGLRKLRKHNINFEAENPQGPGFRSTKKVPSQRPALASVGCGIPRVPVALRSAHLQQRNSRIILEIHFFFFLRSVLSQKFFWEMGEREQTPGPHVQEAHAALLSCRHHSR